MINNSRILGIDPGYGRLGIAVIENERGNQKLVYSECFETSNNLPHEERLALIGDRVKFVIKKFKPNKLGLETLLFSKNVKTALQVAEARGVILAESARKNIEVVEFNPNSIKMAVTGYGKSDKKQIMDMLHKILKINKIIKHDDEYDAIAVAITCAV